MSDTTGIVFPHQLFADTPLTAVCHKLILVEEWLFFRQYRFHKQKIAFHRATMKFYESYLNDSGVETEYIESSDDRSDVRLLLAYLKEQGIDNIHYVEVTDNWLQKRISTTAASLGISLHKHSSPLFISAYADTLDLLKGKRTLRQTDFYITQRRGRRILTTSEGAPVGGKWTYDTDNRQRYPSGLKPPAIPEIPQNAFTIEAVNYTRKHFPSNPGSLESGILYPVTFNDTLAWFEIFLNERFNVYGSYQDAIMQDETFMHHSVVSPMLNAGLISPSRILYLVLEHAEAHSAPLNSTEGFIRQLMGWREFIRGVYELYGSRQRTLNYWGFTRKIPPAFWYGSTGIVPIDITIQKVLKTAYCHHIERLMVLSNFMLLCEFHPDEVYRWFMEMFIDAYDWVMVPNVYGMGQYADGGMMSTKPYISGSNYLKKMADYTPGSWQETWDALFWRFIHRQRGYFGKNPRMRMMVTSFDRMTPEKRSGHLNRAEKYLGEMDLLAEEKT